MVTTQHPLKNPTKNRFNLLDWNHYKLQSIIKLILN